MMVEANSWGFSIFFSRNGKFDLEERSPWVISDGTGNTRAYHPRPGTFDIRIELHDLVRDGWWYELSDSDSLLGNIDGRGAASIVFPSTLSCFKQCEHVVLSETQELQLGTRDMSVIPWVNALSSATKLRELDLRVSEKTLQSVQGILGGWKEHGQITSEVTLPCLESMTFWEHRFLSRDCSSSPKADTTQGTKFSSNPT
jgi:hypothetical protein